MTPRPSRRTRLAAWWRSARSTEVENRWEARFWMVIAVLGVAWAPLRESIPVLFFISAWTAYKAAAGNRQTARISKKAAEAHEGP